jgi:hypothetical protein
MNTLTVPSADEFGFVLGLLIFSLGGISGCIACIVALGNVQARRVGNIPDEFTPPTADGGTLAQEGGASNSVTVGQLLHLAIEPTWLTGLLVILTVGTLQMMLATSTGGPPPNFHYVWPLATYTTTDIGSSWINFPITHLPNFAIGMCILYLPARYTDTAVRILAGRVGANLRPPNWAPIGQWNVASVMVFGFLVTVTSLFAPMYYLGLLFSIPGWLPLVVIGGLVPSIPLSSYILGIFDAFVLIGWYLFVAAIWQWRR